MSLFKTLLIIILIIILAIAGQTYLISKEHAQLNNKLAELLANDMANRMQLNHQEAFKGKSSFYVHPVNLAQHLNFNCTKEPDGCSPQTTAANDLTYWRRALHENLPHGSGKITMTKNNYLIQISWQDQFNHTHKTFISHIFGNSHEHH